MHIEESLKLGTVWGMVPEREASALRDLKSRCPTVEKLILELMDIVAEEHDKAHEQNRGINAFEQGAQAGLEPQDGEEREVV